MNSGRENTSSTTPRSFEAILNEKLMEVSKGNEELSSLRFSVTKSSNEYSGTLLIDSSKGKFFATAVSRDVRDVTHSLTEQIGRQMRLSRIYPQNLLRAM